MISRVMDSAFEFVAAQTVAISAQTTGENVTYRVIAELLNGACQQWFDRRNSNTTELTTKARETNSHARSFACCPATFGHFSGRTTRGRIERP